MLLFLFFDPKLIFYVQLFILRNRWKSETDFTIFSGFFFFTVLTYDVIVTVLILIDMDRVAKTGT